MAGSDGPGEARWQALVEQVGPFVEALRMIGGGRA